MLLRSAADAAHRHGPAELLCLAAAPSFGVMALVNALSAPPMMCGAMPGDGMTSMYLMMSVFHAAPWLKLLGSRRLRGR